MQVSITPHEDSLLLRFDEEPHQSEVKTFGSRRNHECQCHHWSKDAIPRQLAEVRASPLQKPAQAHLAAVPPARGPSRVGPNQPCWTVDEHRAGEEEVKLLSHIGSAWDGMERG